MVFRRSQGKIVSSLALRSHIYNAAEFWSLSWLRLANIKITRCGGLMKRISLLVVIATLCAGSQAQQAKATERMFLPSDTFWGYAQFDIAPPHNEIDPNICSANAANFVGVNAP